MAYNTSTGTFVGQHLSASSDIFSRTALTTEGNLNISGSTALGDNAADVITITGQLTASQGMSASLDLAVAGNYTGSGTISGTIFYGDGSGLTGITAGAVSSYTNPANNRVITSVDSSTINGEANLSFDGSTLSVTGDTSGSGNLTAHKFYTGQGNTTISKLGVISSSADATLTSASLGTVYTAGQLQVAGVLQAGGTCNFGGPVNTYNTVTMTQDLNAASSSFTNMYGSGHLQIGGNILGSTVTANGGNISGSGNFLLAGGITGGNSGWSIDGSGDATVNATKVTTISASSTLEVVGASYLGATLDVTGNVSCKGSITGSAQITAHNIVAGQGDYSVSATAAVAMKSLSVNSDAATISDAGDGTFAGLSLSNGGINNTGPLANVTTISGSSTLEMVGNTYLGGTLNVTGAVTLDGPASGSTAGPGSFLATTAAGLVVLDTPPYPPSYADGLRLTFYTVETVTIGTGDCRDAANTANIPSTGSLNVAITGSGANGLDTGSEATSTWYAVYIISGSSGVAGLMSTSATAPTMPSGYDKKRRIGWVYNHSDDDLQNFYMEGSARDRITWWNESGADYRTVLDAGVSNASWTEVDVSSRVPTTADSMWVVGYNSAGGATSARVRPADFLVGTGGTGVTYMLVIESQSRWGVQQFFCVDTKAIQYYSDSGVPRTSIYINGWKETI